MSLYLLIVKEAIQKQLFFLCQFWQAQPGQLCLLKVAELLLLNFCGFNNFQLRNCFRIGAEIPKSENCIGIF
jgi:hypothetical protein